jgi:hypothetical protein
MSDYENEDFNDDDDLSFDLETDLNIAATFKDRDRVNNFRTYLEDLTQISGEDLKTLSLQEIYGRLMTKQLSNRDRFYILLDIFSDRYADYLEISDINKIKELTLDIEDYKLIKMNPICFMIGYQIFIGKKNDEYFYDNIKAFEEDLISESDIFRYIRYFQSTDDHFEIVEEVKKEKAFVIKNLRNNKLYVLKVTDSIYEEKVYNIINEKLLKPRKTINFVKIYKDKSMEDWFRMTKNVSKDKFILITEYIYDHTFFYNILKPSTAITNENAYIHEILKLTSIIVMNLVLLSELNINHNDLHSNNILISPHPDISIYAGNDNLVINGYKPYIFDYGNSTIKDDENKDNLPAWAGQCSHFQKQRDFLKILCDIFTSTPNKKLKDIIVFILFKDISKSQELLNLMVNSPKFGGCYFCINNECKKGGKSALCDEIYLNQINDPLTIYSLLVQYIKDYNSINTLSKDINDDFKSGGKTVETYINDNVFSALSTREEFEELKNVVKSIISPTDKVEKCIHSDDVDPSKNIDIIKNSGFNLTLIDGDGNCQYNAIAVQLNIPWGQLKEIMTDKLRSILFDYVASHGIDFVKNLNRDFMFDDDNEPTYNTQIGDGDDYDDLDIDLLIEEVIKYYKTAGMYGDELILKAISISAGICINVYKFCIMKDSGKIELRKIQTYPDENCNNYQVNILHNMGNHYDALILINTSFVQFSPNSINRLKDVFNKTSGVDMELEYRIGTITNDGRFSPFVHLEIWNFLKRSLDEKGDNQLEQRSTVYRKNNGVRKIEFDGKEIYQYKQNIDKYNINFKNVFFRDFLGIEDYSLRLSLAEEKTITKNDYKKSPGYENIVQRIRYSYTLGNYSIDLTIVLEENEPEKYSIEFELLKYPDQFDIGILNYILGTLFGNATSIEI